eukprot:364299-Chlamydomonas_euryale.AAC.7
MKVVLDWSVDRSVGRSAGWCNSSSRRALLQGLWEACQLRVYGRHIQQVQSERGNIKSSRCNWKGAISNPAGAIGKGQYQIQQVQLERGNIKLSADAYDGVILCVPFFLVAQAHLSQLKSHGAVLGTMFSRGMVQPCSPERQQKGTLTARKPPGVANVTALAAAIAR